MPNDSPALTEAEKRLHRCCFTGYRPEKLDAPEAEVEAGLSRQIDQAIADGYRTFICGMGMGVDITAGHLVMRRKESDPSLHLICAVPWPGFAAKWKYIWEAPLQVPA